MLGIADVLKAAPKIGKPVKDFLLGDDLFLEQWIIPKGSTVGLYQTKNFGWVILEPEQRSTRGDLIPKRLFKW